MPSTPSHDWSSILNGKKTVIGFLCLFISGMIEAFFNGSGYAMPGFLSGCISVLQYVGNVIGGVGVAHKVFKGDFS